MADMRNYEEQKMRTPFELNREVHAVLEERIPVAFELMVEEEGRIAAFVESRSRRVATQVEDLLARNPKLTPDTAFAIVRYSQEWAAQNLNILGRQAYEELSEPEDPQSAVRDLINMNRHD